MSKKEILANLLEEKLKYKKYHFIDSLFPDTGKYSRDLYSKHVDFMNAGKDYLMRAFVSANRCGKTVTGGYEVTMHLTGDYPHWWEGRRFDRPTHFWVAGDTNETTKEILQEQVFLGPIDDMGTGFIPKDRIVRIVRKSGVADSVGTVYVRHQSGGISSLGFKSYEQGRKTFQGTKKDGIWLDEEPSDTGIFSECLTRTAGDEGNEGMIICTFTPLSSLSDVVLSFLPDGLFPEGNVHPKYPYKYITHVDWDEVPHLSEEWKRKALDSYSDYELLARTKGIPSGGSYTIYPYIDDQIAVEPFQIPVWWPRAYGLDVGWNKAGAIWGARDPDTGVIYIYSEYKIKKEVPAMQTSAIKDRGDWMIGAFGDQSRYRTGPDGQRLLDLYTREGLDLIPAKDSLESGILHINQLFRNGQLKVFSNLPEFLRELHIYRRDESGQIVRKNDHLMDALRVLIMTGMEYANTPPDPDADYEHQMLSGVGRSNVTGY